MLCIQTESRFATYFLVGFGNTEKVMGVLRVTTTLKIHIIYETFPISQP